MMQRPKRAIQNLCIIISNVNFTLKKIPDICTFVSRLYFVCVAVLVYVDKHAVQKYYIHNSFSVAIYLIPYSHNYFQKLL